MHRCEEFIIKLLPVKPKRQFGVPVLTSQDVLQNEFIMAISI